MKNRELKHIFSALQAETPETPYHRQMVRQAVLAPRRLSQPSVTARFLGPHTNLKGVLMKRSLVSITGFAVVAVTLTGVLLFSPLNPHVSAMNQVKQSLSEINRLPSTDLVTIRERLVGDPKTILDEAQSAQDLTKISRAEYEQLVKKARFVNSMAKTADGSVVAKIDGTTSTHGTIAINQSGNVSMNPLDASSIPSAKSSQDTANASAGDMSQSAEAEARANQAITDLQNAPANTTEFVRYTNNQKQIVVLAFDGDNKPLFRTIIEL